jgi:hypothetical protein
MQQYCIVFFNKQMLRFGLVTPVFTGVSVLAMSKHPVDQNKDQNGTETPAS